VLRVPQVAGVPDHDRGNSPQPCDDLPSVVEPTHMGIAGGEIAIWVRVARILLDRQEKYRHRLIEAPSQEMCGAYYHERSADTGARAETQSGQVARY
jgi:hypothetical protein